MKVKNKVSGQIVAFSPKVSRLRRMQKRVMCWSEVIKPYFDQVGISKRLVMITLTYEKVDAWKPGHIREFMLKIRKELSRNLKAYAWVAELQQRGAVHYHILLLVERGTKIELPDKAGWWVHGSSRIETARSPFYILTYTGKEYQKGGIFPKGLRVFAVWIAGDVVSAVTRWFFRLSTLPGWLREAIRGDISTVGAKFKRVPGGGWECAGIFYKSPWEIVDYG